MDTGTHGCLTPEEQSDLASVPVVSGANGPRPKLVNTGKQVLNLVGYNFMGLAGNETIKVRAIETLRNMVSTAAAPLDSTVLLVRFFSLLLMAP